MFAGQLQGVGTVDLLLELEDHNSSGQKPFSCMNSWFFQLGTYMNASAQYVETGALIGTCGVVLAVFLMPESAVAEVGARVALETF